LKIDAFSHIQPPEYSRRVREFLERGEDKEKLEEWDIMLQEDPALLSLDARWHSMERFDDYRQILVPGAPAIESLGSPEEVGKLAHDLNEELAALVAEYPEAFAGFVAALPLADVDMALEEFDHATGKLGALGAQIYTNVLGKPLDRPEFEPLYDRAEASDKALWLHPQRSESRSDYPDAGEDRSVYEIYWSFGWPYETAAAMARLVYSGVMQRHPRLKIITHHGGGLVPLMRGRLREWPWGKEAAEVRERLDRHPIEYFRQFYCDTAMMGASFALRCSLEFFGLDHVLFGSDFGFGNDYLAKTIIDITALHLDPAETDQLYSGNAKRLLL